MRGWFGTFGKGSAGLALVAILNGGAPTQIPDSYMPEKVGEYSVIRVLVKDLRKNHKKTPEEAFQDLSKDNFPFEANDKASNLELYFAPPTSSIELFLLAQMSQGIVVTRSATDCAYPTLEVLADKFYNALLPAAEMQRLLYAGRILNQDLSTVDPDAVIYQPNAEGTGGALFILFDPKK